jgi:DNA-binding transcriptional regulator YiaG
MRKALALTQSQFAALLGVHLVTVKKWETGAQRMRATHDRLIRLLMDKHAGTAGETRPARRSGAPKKSKKRRS